jgi:molybdopterin synthase catalytic subunit
MSLRLLLPAAPLIAAVAYRLWRNPKQPIRAEPPTPPPRRTHPDDLIELTPDPFEAGSLSRRVVRSDTGAVASFTGTTRDNFGGKRVLRLEYEAYEPMAILEIRSICAAARVRWQLRVIAITHRTGLVPIGEPSIEIAISSAHRKDALEAVHFAIDELKARVPIWKKEVYDEDAPLSRGGGEAEGTVASDGRAAAWKTNAEANMKAPTR